VEAKEGSCGYNQPEAFQEKMHEMLKKQGLVLFLCTKKKS
jgi:hypothetical protein